MPRSLSPALRRATFWLLLALLCLFGCQHGSSPPAGDDPLGVASLRSSGNPPSDTVGHPSPGSLGLDNAVCPAFDAGKLPAPLAPSKTTAAGTAAGSFAVSPTGQASYTIPLVVPPGRRGMEPRLAIAYDSSRGEGPLGVGFALQGLSAITRCPSNMAQDGRIRAVVYDGGDRFCLDGLRIVEVGTKTGAQGPFTIEARTFPDTMRKILAHFGPIPEDGPQSWTVYERNGDIREYGDTSDSQAKARRGTVAAWYLSSERDRRGNAVDYAYENDAVADGHTQEILVREIRYTRQDNGEAPTRRLTFEYDLTEPRTLFSGGLSFIQSHVLRTLRMTTEPSDTLVRSYRLDYARGEATRRSRLVSVAECAGDGVCKPSTRFTWTDDPPALSQSKTPVMLPPDRRSVQLDQGFGKWTLADVNGDGLEDLVVVFPNEQSVGTDDWRVALNRGGFFAEPELWATLPHPATLTGPSISSDESLNEENWTLTPMDYDQDGITDILLDTPNPDPSTWHDYMWLKSVPGATLGHRFELKATAVPQPPGIQLDQSLYNHDPQAMDSRRFARVGDVNGDGIGDLIECSNPTWADYGYNPTAGTPIWTVRLWVDDVPGVGGPGWEANAIPLPGTDGVDCAMGLAFVHVVDIDGSGASSIVMPQLDGKYGALRLEKGQWVKLATALDVQPNGRRIHWLGTTADGVPDVVYTGLDAQKTCQPGVGCVNWNQGAQFAGFPYDVPFLSVNNGAGEFLQPKGMLGKSLGGRWMTDAFGDQGIALDFDGDGRLDFMLPMGGQCPDHDPDHACWVVLRSPKAVRGVADDADKTVTTGFADVLPTAIGEIVDDVTSVPHTWYDPKVTDVDGDGRQDLVAPSIAGDGTFTIYRNSGPEDLLVAVTDGMSPLDPSDPGFEPTVSIAYGSLVDNSITQDIAPDDPTRDWQNYLKHADPNNTCAFPRTCVAGPGRVVSSYSLNDGQNQPRYFLVQYRDGRYHRLGRGMLGFGERIVIDQETGAGRAELYDNTTWDDALQVFPFAGQMVESWSWAPARAVPLNVGDPAGKPTQVELVYGKTTLREVPTDPKTFFTLPIVVERKRSEATFQAKAGQTLYRFADTTRSDAKAVLGDVQTVVSSFDPDFGDVLQQDTIVPGTDFDDSLTRTVENDTAHWLLGEVTYEQACSEGLPAMQCRTTSRTFNGYGEVASVESGDPTDPETQLSTTYYRDGFGNVTLTTAYDQAGHSRSACTSYEPEGIFPYATVNPAGHTSRFAFDSDLGVLTGTVDPNGLVTHYRHDGFGRSTEVDNPDGSSTTRSFERKKNGGPSGDWWAVEVETLRRRAVGHQAARQPGPPRPCLGARRRHGELRRLQQVRARAPAGAGDHVRPFRAPDAGHGALDGGRCRGRQGCRHLPLRRDRAGDEARGALGAQDDVRLPGQRLLRHGLAGHGHARGRRARAHGRDHRQGEGHGQDRVRPVQPALQGQALRRRDDHHAPRRVRPGDPGGRPRPRHDDHTLRRLRRGAHGRRRVGAPLRVHVRRHRAAGRARRLG